MALIGVEMFTNPSYEELSTSLGFLSDDNMTEYLIYNQVLDSDITAVGSSGLKDSLRSRNVSMINIQKYIDENPPDFDKLKRMADTHYSGHVSSVQPRPSGPGSSAQPHMPYGPVSSAQQPGHLGPVSSAQQPGHLEPVYYREDGHRDDRRGHIDDRRGYRDDRRGHIDDRRGYRDDGRGYRDDGRGYRDKRFETSRRYNPPYAANNFSTHSHSRSPSRRIHSSRGGGTIKYKKSLATKRSRKVYKKKYKKKKTIKRKKRL